MIEDMAAYQTAYQKENVVRKVLKFNRKKESDVKLLEWVESQDETFNRYCKRLISADMAEHSNRTE